MKNDLKRKFSLNSSTIFSVVELSKWVLSSFIYYLVALLPKTFIISLILSLNLWIVLFSDCTFLSCSTLLQIYYLISFSFLFPLFYSLDDCISFFSSLSLCRELRGMMIFQLLQLFCHLIPRFSNPNPEHINAFSSADASHWVYGKTNWKIKMFIVVFVPLLQTMLSKTITSPMIFSVDTFRVCMSAMHTNIKTLMAKRETKSIENTWKMCNSCIQFFLWASETYYTNTLSICYYNTFVVNTIQIWSISACYFFFASAMHLCYPWNELPAVEAEMPNKPLKVTWKTAIWFAVGDFRILFPEKWLEKWTRIFNIIFDCHLSCSQK